MTSEVKAERRYNDAEGASLNPTHDLWVNRQSERNQRHTKSQEHEKALTDRHVGSGACYPYWGISMSYQMEVRHIAVANSGIYYEIPKWKLHGME